MADFFSDIGRQVSSLATTVSDDVDNFVAGAQQNVAQLTGSRVQNGKIVGPLADHLGSDPVTFTMNATKHFATFFRDVVNRVQLDTGRTEFSVPAPSGRGGNIRVPAKVTKADGNSRLALVTALCAIHNPAELLDEASRSRQGIPARKASRGFYGERSSFVWFPASGIGGRGFFGIDEAAAGAAALAIIVAIAPAIITALIAVVGAVAPDVIKGVTDVINPGAKDKKPPPPDDKIFGVDPMFVVVGVVLVVGVVIVVATRKKGAPPA